MKINKSISLVGKICSGKSTISQIINDQYQFVEVKFGKYISSLCVEKGIEISRENLQNEGELLVRANPRMFLENTIKFFTSLQKVDIVLDSIRHLSVFNILKKISEKNISIFIDLDLENRYNRYLKRHFLNINDFSIEDFKKIDNHVVEKETEELKYYCDYLLDGKKEIFELKNDIFKILNFFPN